MIRGLTFASCYVYSPGGSGDVSDRSRLLRTLLKESDERFLVKYAVRVRQQVTATSPLAGFLGPHHVLVPIPGSAPCARESASQRLALALLRQGLGFGVWPGLRRLHAVQKSATAVPGSRPTVSAHYESLVVDPRAAIPLHVVLIDDIVTKGRTLLAAAARLQEARPDIHIRAFALVRTMGLVSGVTRLLDPCVGEIQWKWGDAYRTP